MSAQSVWTGPGMENILETLRQRQVYDFFCKQEPSRRPNVSRQPRSGYASNTKYDRLRCCSIRRMIDPSEPDLLPTPCRALAHAAIVNIDSSEGIHPGDKWFVERFNEFREHIFITIAGGSPSAEIASPERSESLEIESSTPEQQSEEATVHELKERAIQTADGWIDEQSQLLDRLEERNAEATEANDRLVEELTVGAEDYHTRKLRFILDQGYHSKLNEWCQKYNAIQRQLANEVHPFLGQCCAHAAMTGYGAPVPCDADWALPHASLSGVFASRSSFSNGPAVPPGRHGLRVACPRHPWTWEPNSFREHRTKTARSIYALRDCHYKLRRLYHFSSDYKTKMISHEVREQEFLAEVRVRRMHFGLEETVAARRRLLRIAREINYYVAIPEDQGQMPGEVGATGADNGEEGHDSGASYETVETMDGALAGPDDESDSDFETSSYEGSDDEDEAMENEQPETNGETAPES